MHTSISLSNTTCPYHIFGQFCIWFNDFTMNGWLKLWWLFPWFFHFNKFKVLSSWNSMICLWFWSRSELHWYFMGFGNNKIATTNWQMDIDKRKDRWVSWGWWVLSTSRWHLTSFTRIPIKIYDCILKWDPVYQPWVTNNHSINYVIHDFDDAEKIMVMFTNH